MEILLIDDDEDFNAAVHDYFEGLGVEISTLSDASLAPALNFGKIKCLILEVDLPNVSGIEILKLMPSDARPFIIMVSGHNVRETRINCLESGADFFIPKPVDLRELALIVGGVLGRERKAETATPSWVLHQDNMSLVPPMGDELGLSLSEFKVLKMLMVAPGQIINKNDLELTFSFVGAAPSRSENKLEVLLSRLRRRARASGNNLPIKAARGMGYVFHGKAKVLADLDD